MKVLDTDIDLRVEDSPEKIEMVAHTAGCRYCKGIVKMMRNMETGRYNQIIVNVYFVVKDIL